MQVLRAVAWVLIVYPLYTQTRAGPLPGGHYPISTARSTPEQRNNVSYPSVDSIPISGRHIHCNTVHHDHRSTINFATCDAALDAIRHRHLYTLNRVWYPNSQGHIPISSRGSCSIQFVHAPDAPRLTLSFPHVVERAVVLLQACDRFKLGGRIDVRQNSAWSVSVGQDASIRTLGDIAAITPNQTTEK